jgi:hypothetical protein
MRYPVSRSMKDGNWTFRKSDRLDIAHRVGGDGGNRGEKLDAPTDLVLVAMAHIAIPLQHAELAVLVGIGARCRLGWRCNTAPWQSGTEERKRLGALP